MIQPTLFDTVYVTPPERRNASLRAIVGTGYIESKSAQIRKFVRNNPDCTQSEMERGTGLKINVISGRVNEMTKRGVFETGERYKPETEKYVTTYKMKNDQA